MIIKYIKQSNPIMMAAILLLIFSLYYLPDAVSLFGFSFLISYLFSPFVKWMEGYGMNRSISAFIITMVIVLLMTILLIFIIPILRSEVLIIANIIPKYFIQIKKILMNIINQYGDLVDKETLNTQLNKKISDIVGVIPNMITGVFNNSLAIASSFTMFLIAPISVFFILKDWPMIIKKFNLLFYNPTHDNDIVENLFKEIDKSLMQYVRGQAVLCCFMGLFYTMFLTFIGLRHGFAIGILSGFLLFIPYIGNLVSFIICIILAAAQFGSLFHVFIVIAVFVFGQLIENLYLVPTFVGRNIGVHPVWILFSLLLSSRIFGLTGIILTMPMLAIIAAILRFYNIKKNRHDSLQ